MYIATVSLIGSTLAINHVGKMSRFLNIMQAVCRAISEPESLQICPLRVKA
jgi:hypothetical protein